MVEQINITMAQLFLLLLVKENIDDVIWSILVVEIHEQGPVD